MAWSDVPTVLKQILGYFGPEQHERRVLRKFIGLWDLLRSKINIPEKDKRELKYLEKMDKLREELK